MAEEAQRWHPGIVHAERFESAVFTCAEFACHVAILITEFAIEDEEVGRSQMYDIWRRGAVLELHDAGEHARLPR